MSKKEFEKRVGNLENRVSVIETKLDMFIDEMRDFKTEVRTQTQEIKSGLSNVKKHVQILAVTAVGGMVATIIGVAAIAYAILSK